MNKKYDIFISYRRAHSIKVEHIYDELKDKFNVFFDQEGIHTGEIFENKILSALSSSKVLLLVLTKDACNEFKIRSKDSDWLIKEIKYAKDNNIPILPIIIYNEEDAREVNLLINKELQQCIPDDISFLPQMQFNKIRLERKARKSDINNLINEIEQGLYNKEIIETIKPTNSLDKHKINKKSKLKYLIIFFIILFILVGGGYYLLNNKYNKKYHKGIATLTTNQSPSKIPTLSVSNKRGSSKRWLQSIHIDSSEILSFELHYYTGYVGAKNLRASIDNLNGKFFKEDEKIIVRGKISADNLDTSYGQVTVIFDENVSLKLHRISWQKTGCQSVECETGLSANYNDLFKKNGLLLGDVPKDDDSYYYGNLIVEYKITDIRKDSKIDTSSKKYTTKENFDFTANKDPNHIPTLSVSNKNGFDWFDDIDINIGDHLAFQIHYYGWHFGMKNPKVFINTLDNMEFKKGDTIKVYARVMADNLKAAEGFVKVTFNENIKLILDHISLQENRCRSFKCESEIKGDKLKIFSKEGLELRDIPMKNNNDYFGNIVVRYKVVKPDAS